MSFYLWRFDVNCNMRWSYFLNLYIFLYIKIDSINKTGNRLKKFILGRFSILTFTYQLFRTWNLPHPQSSTHSWIVMARSNTASIFSNVTEAEALRLLLSNDSSGGLFILSGCSKTVSQRRSYMANFRKASATAEDRKKKTLQRPPERNAKAARYRL